MSSSNKSTYKSRTIKNISTVLRKKFDIRLVNSMALFKE